MKHLLLLLIITLLRVTGFSQHNWLQGAGGNANDEALDLVHDNLGNVYSTGYFSMAARFDNIVIPSSGMSDVFVAKQDSLGTYLWVVPAGGIMDEKATAITVNGAGEIFITGVFRGTALFGSTSLTSIAGSQDVFIAKLDNAGNFIWAKSYGGADTDLPNDICTDAFGNIIVGGEFKGTSTFGSYTFTSVNYPPTMASGGGLPSYDAFIFKTNSSGTVTWAKQGSALYDDRILKIAVDAQDNIYTCGQFSDTISFTGTYPNNAFNAGLVMKLDTAGNEMWFRRMIASQFMVYDMKVKEKNIWMTGDFQGAFCYIGTPNDYLTNPSIYKVFAVKVNTLNGDYITGTTEGSDNSISSRGITIDQQSNIFTAGYFKCSLTTFSAIHGNGIFNSVGFRDIYVVKYDSLLHRTWEKQYGGIGDDYPTALDVYFNDQPVFAGSYSKNFNTPDGFNFTTHVNNLNTLNGNFGLTLCGAMSGGAFVTQKGWGNKDILISRPVNNVTPPYDYFKRISGTCVNDTLMPYRWPLGDTITGCDFVYAGINTPTTVDSLQAPDWVYNWSNGATHFRTKITSSGLYYVDYGYADDCRRFVDSFYVQIYATPPTPIITAHHCIDLDAIPLTPCLHKALIPCGDTAMFVASGIPAGYTFHWNLPGGATSTNDTIYAYLPGNYSLTSSSPGGMCNNGECIDLFTYGPCGGGYAGGTGLPLSAITPMLIFTDTTFNTTDTVRVCANDHFRMRLVDSASFYAGLPSFVATYVHWTITGGYTFDPYLSYSNTFWDHTQDFKALTSGICTATANILDPITGTSWGTVSRTFYLDAHSAPSNVPLISGATYFCPGDSVTLSASGGDNYVWGGPGLVNVYPSGDSAIVNQEGQYTLTSTTTDTVLGCSSTQWYYFDLHSMPAPLVTMLPANGLVCPFDSVQLTAQPGSSYLWYGPTGMVLGTTASIWTSTPGIYYYTYISPTGCLLVSEMVEVKEYSTPYLESAPGTSLCASGSVIITLQTNDASTINWATPFSGSSLTQTITSPGTYTVSVNSCSITTVASITITTGTGAAVDLMYWGNDTICSQDTVILVGSPGFVDYTWIPSMETGMSYTTTGPGTYYVQATNLEGCISSDSVIVYAYPEVTPPTVSDTTVCPGTSLTLNASGTGSIYWFNELVNGNVVGTGSSLPVSMGQNDSTFFVANNNGTCMSAAVPVNVNIFNGSQKPVIIGRPVVCAGDTLFLEVGAPAAGTTYTWNGPGITAFDSTHLFVYPVTLATSGYYSVTAFSGFCASQTDSIYITVNDPVLHPFTSSSYVICQYDTLILLTDTLPGSYLWNNGSTAMNNPVTAAGQYYYTYTDPSGCTAQSDTTALSLLAAPLLAAIPDTSVCAGTPLTYTATNDSSLVVSWYDAAHNFLAGGFTYSISTVTGPTILIVEATDTNGCTSLSNTITISITPPVASPILTVSDSICTGDSLVLSANSLAGYTYYWSGPGGFSSGSISPLIYPVTASSGGIYQLYVVNGYCVSDTGSVTITTVDPPTITASGDIVICAGNSAMLSAVSSTGNYSWSTGETTSAVSVAPVSTTTYSVQASNRCGTVSDDVTVTINPNPLVNAGPDMTLISGETGTINASASTGTYSWTPSAGLSCINCLEPVVDTNATGTYYLTVTDANGCSSTDEITVIISEECSAFFPNAFSPNGDGVNDVFRIKGDNITSVRMMIFDRWGEKVFETNDKNSGWDGKYKGDIAEPQVFVYKIFISFANGEEHKYTGPLTLIK
ncbi:MAG: gliding motility-associated C-terminal domain-containing protein [Bacteroidia bacterium]